MAISSINVGVIYMICHCGNRLSFGKPSHYRMDEIIFKFKRISPIRIADSQNSKGHT